MNRLTPALLLLLLAPAAGGEPPVETPRVPDPPRVGDAPAEPRTAIPGLPDLRSGGKLVLAADEASRRRLPVSEGNGKLSRVSLKGNVRASRNDMEMTCRELEVVFEDVPAEDGGKPRPEPRSARARGEVIVRTARRKAIAGEAAYDFGRELLTLSGEKRPVIYQDGDAIAAERFEVHRARGAYRAVGRTTAVIRPREKPGDAGAEKRPPERDENGAPDLRKKTRIDSENGAVYEEAAARLFLRGKVLVRQKGLRLSCARAWALFHPGKKKAEGEAEKGPKGPGALRKVIIAGDVRMESGKRAAEGEIAAYDPEKKTVTLAGGKRPPTISDGDSWLTAPLIIYHLETDRIESPNGPLKAVVKSEKP